MKALDFSNVITKDLPWFQLFVLDVPLEVVAEWAGVNPHVMWRDGLDNADYFAVEFECGLMLAFECGHEYGPSLVVSIEPVLQHAQRHLSHWETHFQSIFDSDEATLDRGGILKKFGERMPHLLESDRYQLMRQGDDGNQFPIGEPTSKLDANCWMAELEARGHKQTYWIVKR